MSEKVYDKVLHDDLHQLEANDASAHNTHSLGNELIKRFAKEVLQLIKEGLLRDGIVRIHNFGTFRLKMSNARAGYNPRTREPIKIPPRARVLFAPAKMLRENVEPDPKPIIPITAVEAAVKTPAPPKAENPIAVALPTQTQTARAEKNEPIESQDLESDADIIARASFASMVQNAQHTDETARLNQNTPLSTFKQGNNDHELDDDKETPLDALSNNDATSDSAAPLIESQEPTASNSPPQSDFDTSKQFKATRALSDNESADFNLDLTPVENLKSYRTAKTNNETPSYTEEPSHSIDHTENDSSWRAIGIVSVLMLLLLGVLLFWLLPLSDPKTPAPNIIAHKEYKKPSVVSKQTIVATQKNTKPFSEKNLTSPIEDTKSKNNDSTAQTIAATSTADTKEAQKDLTATTATNNKPILSQPFFAAKIHKVISGDNLWRLAGRNYINPFLWPHIYQFNNDTISNPNVLEVNNTITLPALHGHPSKLTKVDRHSIAQGYWLLYQHYKKTGQKNAHYALLGVKWFDPKVLEENLDQVLLDDKNRLNAKRSDNRMIQRAMMYGS